MDKQSAKTILTKLNILFENIEDKAAEPAAVERDLLLRYVRDLYDALLSDATPPSRMPEPLPVQEQPPVPMEQPRFDLHQSATSDLPKVAETTPTPPRQPQPAAEPDEEIAALFAFSRARELSEKLGEQAIDNLQTALSINDILWYSNELFEREQNVFKESLATLNRFENFEQAKSFLLSLAEQYQWTDRERREVARSFIKIIRRRFSGN